MVKHRYLRLALLPFLGLIFIFGWILVFFSDQKANPKRQLKQVVRAAKESTLEVGLLSAVGEESSQLKEHSKRIHES